MPEDMDLSKPMPEASSAVCHDCFWGASGPWSHRAAVQHQEDKPGHTVHIGGPLL